MAQAPRPGVSARQEATDAAQRVLTIRLRDETFNIAAGNVPLRVKNRFMRETGQAIEWYLQPERAASADVALCGLWFLDRLLSGMTVTWEQTLDDWDAAKFTADDIEVIETTPDGDGPKGDDPEV